MTRAAEAELRAQEARLLAAMRQHDLGALQDFVDPGLSLDRIDVEQGSRRVREGQAARPGRAGPRFG